ncbi:type II secretion system F family protein [Luteimicrobium sp. DT211]|uniref:type II secretion system F family protein n=1 Tax=Luteimicrobium sp. DT211 TaxID=3393412 RepID=UPI003CF9AB84
MSGAGTGVGVAVIVLVALAPWWLRGDAPQVRARSLACEAPAGGTLGGRQALVGSRLPTSRALGAVGPVDAEVVLALVAAACRSGASVARALDAVGAALGGGGVASARGGRGHEEGAGATLRSVASRLALGAPWEGAWADAGDVPSSDRAAARVLLEALRPAWEHGAPPEPALRAATDQLRRDRAERSATAAGRLGVRLVLPLGLCYLPAFVLVGLVPVLVSYGIGLLGGG